MGAQTRSSVEAVPDRDATVVVTGGAGFVGSNLADRLLGAGWRVVVFDSFARPGVEANARWLESRHGRRVTIVRGDVRECAALRPHLTGAAAVFHFAAQVAVTTSLVDPRHDFEVNALGTLQVLEEVRRLAVPPFFALTSTNKVYGDLGDLELRVHDRRYEPVGSGAPGVGELRPLDLHTPYGCSKGAADQYTLDYARMFGIPAVVFRMSCIYGPRQFGTEDQGWVAHLLQRAMRGLPITVFGDGMQVRDILYVDDLVDALLLAWEHAPRTTGRAFNIGGGPANIISLLDLLDDIVRLEERTPDVRFEHWRPGDQRWYVSDTRAFRGVTGWQPQVGAREGIRRLHAWLAAESSARERAAAVVSGTPGDAPEGVAGGER